MLEFIEDSVVVEQWDVSAGTNPLDDTVALTRQAKVSPDHTRYLVYEEKYYRRIDSIATRLTCYDASKIASWERFFAGDRRIVFDLTEIYKDIVVFVTADKLTRNPTLEVIAGNNSQQIIQEGEWRRIIDYEVSPHQRYIAIYCRGIYKNRAWDYIVCADIISGEKWQYKFPLCLSCKKGKIQLTTDDEGVVTVSYNDEHRVFSKKGTLIRIYYK